jgi:hypothetical protein
VDESVAGIALLFAGSEVSGAPVISSAFAGAGAFRAELTAGFTAGDEGGSSDCVSGTISRGSESAGLGPGVFSASAGEVLARSGGTAAALDVPSELADKFAEKVDFLERRGFSLC